MTDLSEIWNVESCFSTTKNIEFLMPQCLGSAILAGWWVTLRGSLLSCYKTPWSRGLPRSREKVALAQCLWQLKWQDGDFPWRAPSDKLAWPLVTWSFEITWQTKTNVFSLQQCELILKHSYLRNYMALEPRSLAKSRDKLKPLYLHYHNVYSNQTWQDGDILCGGCTHKVTRPFNHLVLWDHVRS